APAPTSRRAGRASVFVPRRVPGPSSCTRSMRPALPFPARSSPSWRTTRWPMARCGSRRRSCRISARSESPRVPESKRRLRRIAPTAAILLVAVLIGLSLGTGYLVARHFRAEANAMSRLYSGVFSGLAMPEPGGEGVALLRLAEQVRALGMPLVVTDSAGNDTAADNLPPALARLPADHPRIQAYIARLDRSNPPLYDSLLGQRVHYGPMPAERQL